MKEKESVSAKSSNQTENSVKEPVFTKEHQIRARKTFSTLGFGCFAILAVSTALQLACDLIFSRWVSTSWGVWIFNYLPIYVVAVPVSLLIFRLVPSCSQEDGSKNGVPLKAGQIVRALLIAIFLTNVGNAIGVLIMNVLGVLAGTSTESALASVTMNDSVLLKILVMVILAPIFEEFVYRKLLIDRMRFYGEKLTVITSALMFGLFHGNLSQLFYTFALGLLLGYIYLKTGRLRYTVGIHMTFNLFGVFTSFVMLSASDMAVEAMSPGQWLQVAMVLLVLVVEVAGTILGLVLFCRARQNVSYEPAPLEIPERNRFKTVFCNAGMVLFVLACAALIVISTIL